MIKYGDLIGVPYEDCHCGHVAAEALHRMDLIDAAASIPLSHEGAAKLVERHRSGEAVGWVRIGEEPHHAKKEGDIVTFRLPGGHSGIAVLINDVQFITSTDPEGVRVLDARRLPPRCLGVYRWDPR